jgi:hypothetical protein
MKTLPVHWAPSRRFHQSGKKCLFINIVNIVLTYKFLKSKTFSAVIALNRDAHDRVLRRRELKISVLYIKTRKR